MFDNIFSTCLEIIDKLEEDHQIDPPFDFEIVKIPEVQIMKDSD
jgi:hypothetical protein